MGKQNKAAKRKAKVKAQKRQAMLCEQGVSSRLASALEELCAPILPEYIDDSKNPDITGRQIAWQLGQIAWNIAVTGRKELADTAFQNSKLDAEQRAMVRKEIHGLVKQKYAIFPQMRTVIRSVSVQIVNGIPHAKVRQGDTFPELPTPVFDEPEITAEFILALRKTKGMTQVVFAELLGTTARKVSAWEHGKAEPDEEQKKMLFKLQTRA